MKSSSRKTRHKLIISDDDEEILVGIVSAEPDYKISLLLNKELGSRFKSNSPFQVAEGDSELNFSRFTSSSDYNELVLDLISNKNRGEILASKLPGLDYILRVQGYSTTEGLENIISKIRKITEITGVFSLDRVKHFDNNSLLI